MAPNGSLVETATLPVPQWERPPMDRTGHQILPGNDTVDAILAIPTGWTEQQISAALRHVNAAGWTLDLASYSRIHGPYHHFGLVRQG